MDALQQRWLCARFTMFRIIYVTAPLGRLYSLTFNRPYRLAVRTPPFHGGGTGSIPVRVATPFFSASGNCNILNRRQMSSVPNVPPEYVTPFGKSTFWKRCFCSREPSRHI